MNKLKLQNKESIKINSVIITVFILTPLLFSETILLNSINIKINSVIFLIVLNLLFILYNRRNYQNIKLKHIKFHILQIMFLINVIVGSLVSEYTSLSLKRLVLVLYITFSLGSMLLILKNDLNKVMCNFAKAMSFVALIAAIYYFLFLFFGINVVQNNNTTSQKIEILGFEFFQTIVGRRPSSIFLNPNSLGLYMYLSVMLLIYNFLHSKTLNLTNFITVTIFMIVLIGSKSRAPIISLILFFVVFFSNFNINSIISKSTYRKLIIGLITIFSMILLYVLFSRSGKGSSGRLEMWVKAGNVIIKKPIFGIGFGLSNNTLFSGQLSTHNTYIKIAVEMGLINLTIYLYGTYILIKKIALNINNKITTQEKYTGLFLVSFMISFAFYQLFESPVFVYNYTYNIFVFVVTYSIIYIRENNSNVS